MKHLLLLDPPTRIETPRLIVRRYQPGDGLLAVEASPWAEVSIDGERLGETPREVQLTAGVHLVRAVHPELGVREERVTVRAGRRTVWVAEMER